MTIVSISYYELQTFMYIGQSGTIDTDNFQTKAGGRCASLSVWKCVYLFVYICISAGCKKIM